MECNDPITILLIWLRHAATYASLSYMKEKIFKIINLIADIYPAICLLMLIIVALIWAIFFNH